MADQFSRLAKHFSNYWKDKGEDAPAINFDTKQIERIAEKSFRSAAESDTEDKKPVSNISEKSDKPKEKGLNLVSLFTNVDEMVERAVENKVKRIMDRIIDDKIRGALSDDFAEFEKSMSTKVQEKVKSISPKVIEGLKTVAPNVGKATSKDTAPTSFTESVLDEVEEDVVDKKASIEVFPGIYVKASKEDETVGEVFVKNNNELQKMSYVINLPKTNSKKEFVEELQQTFESL